MSVSALIRPDQLGSRYLLLPSRAHPRWMLPASSGASISAGLAAFRPVGRGARNMWRVVAAGRVVFLRVPWTSGRLDTGTILGFVRAAGGGVATVGIEVTRGGARISVAAFTDDGEVAAFTKIGDAADVGVRREAEALAALGPYRVTGLVWPTVLRADAIDGGWGIVTSPLRGRRMDREELAGRDIDALARFLAPDRVRPVTEAMAWRPRWVEAGAWEALRRAVGGSELPWGRVQGDFAPWNAIRVGDDLGLVDWEESGEGLAFHDLFHWMVHWDTRGRRRSHLAVARSVQGKGRYGRYVFRYASAIGVDPAAARAGLIAYLMSPRALGAMPWEPGGEPPRRTRRRVAFLSALARELAGR